MNASREIYRQALDPFRHLSNSNSATADRPDIAHELCNLAFRFYDDHQIKEAEATLSELVEIYLKLAKENPAEYENDLARTLDVMADLYAKTQRLKESEAAYQNAVDIYRPLAKANPDGYQLSLAGDLTSLALLHLEAGSVSQAAAESQEAASTGRELLKTKPSSALSKHYLVRSLIIAGLASQDATEACRFAREAASVTNDPIAMMPQQLTEKANKLFAGCPAR